ncbi:hypothetical protein [Paraburkholderia sp. RL17-337-BIB-A]|uniref:hypothetical protein n=1 Tax=Paraburkholderia sp. RL17-337-BIB-A TaxID=3031636 RepID=UPI0038B928EA
MASVRQELNVTRHRAQLKERLRIAPAEAHALPLRRQCLRFIQPYPVLTSYKFLN